MRGNLRSSGRYFRSMARSDSRPPTRIAATTGRPTHQDKANSQHPPTITTAMTGGAIMANNVQPRQFLQFRFLVQREAPSLSFFSDLCAPSR